MLERIRKDLIAARKRRDKEESSLLSTLLSEITMHAKNDGNREPTDKDALKILKKFTQNVEEVISLKQKQGISADSERQERSWLLRYAPPQMSEEELRAAVERIAEQLPEKSMKMMGSVMASLKQQYDGQFDGKTAASIVKQVLNS